MASGGADLEQILNHFIAEDHTRKPKTGLAEKTILGEAGDLFGLCNSLIMKAFT